MEWAAPRLKIPPAEKNGTIVHSLEESLITINKWQCVDESSAFAEMKQTPMNITLQLEVMDLEEEVNFAKEQRIHELGGVGLGKSGYKIEPDFIFKLGIFYTRSKFRSNGWKKPRRYHVVDSNPLG
ncbi:hypothetical protein NE237_008837 [Protea cynaroides]|uniref:Uncharacterized protein n=1 Tax=Protea cynaroides TaxID=273540 RepID=A0A9Q0R025_9MAGN|nr:hypothetical protein NE237_008837 [Protea cynaroides]